MASGWASVMGREQTGVDHLNMLPALDSPGASDLDHLSGCGEVHPGGSLDGLDSTPHPPPMTGIDPGGGWDVLPGQGLERLAQSLLVAQRREKVVTTTPGDPPGCACLGVHRIGAHHHSVQAWGAQASPSGLGPLVGLACHSLLGQYGAGGVVWTAGCFSDSACLCFRLPSLSPGNRFRPRRECDTLGLSEDEYDCISARSMRQYP